MTLSELRKKRDDARKFLASIFTESLSKKDDGSKEYDFRKVTVLKDGIDTLEGIEKSVKVAEKVRELNAELDEICKQVEDLEAAEKSAEDFHKRESSLKRQPLPGSPDGKEQKTVGQRVTEHETFKKWCAGAKDGKIELADVSINSLKTLFQTSAGWLGESTRIGQVVDAVTRPLQILDIMPVAQTGQPSVVYMEETTRTHAAVERAEGAAAAESTFVLTERNGGKNSKNYTRENENFFHRKAPFYVVIVLGLKLECLYVIILNILHITFIINRFIFQAFTYFYNNIKSKRTPVL